jgi:hypothetical protein
MYDLINANIGIVLQSIDPKTVSGYDWLVQNIPQVAMPQYQKKYGSYWGMRFPDQAYRNVYFQTLQTALLNSPSLQALAASLYNTPTNAKGQSTEFSFTTKLLHSGQAIPEVRRLLARCPLVAGPSNTTNPTARARPERAATPLKPGADTSTTLIKLMDR